MVNYVFLYFYAFQTLVTRILQKQSLLVIHCQKLTPKGHSRSILIGLENSTDLFVGLF